MSGLHGDGILNVFFFFFIRNSEQCETLHFPFRLKFRHHAAKEQMKSAYGEYRANVTTIMILDYSKHHIGAVRS